MGVLNRPAVIRLKSVVNFSRYMFSSSGLLPVERWLAVMTNRVQKTEFTMYRVLFGSSARELRRSSSVTFRSAMVMLVATWVLGVCWCIMVPTMGMNIMVRSARKLVPEVSARMTLATRKLNSVNTSVLRIVVCMSAEMCAPVRWCEKTVVMIMNVTLKCRVTSENGGMVFAFIPTRRHESF